MGPPARLFFWFETIYIDPSAKSGIAISMA
jgi:hypothetical protein